MGGKRTCCLCRRQILFPTRRALRPQSKPVFMTGMTVFSTAYFQTYEICSLFPVRMTVTYGLYCTVQSTICTFIKKFKRNQTKDRFLGKPSFKSFYVRVPTVYVYVWIVLVLVNVQTTHTHPRVDAPFKELC
jgi:hypothetical protein